MKTNKHIITFFIASVLIGCAGSAGCADSHTHEADKKDADHDHDEELQLTEYSSDFEVLAETAPFVTGETSVVKVYVSSLKDFKPLTEGKITVSLTTGGEIISQVLDKPATPGIYDFEIKPAAAGQAQLVFDISTPEKTARITFSEITVYPDEHEAHQALEEAAETTCNTAVFTKAQSWKIDFSTEEVRNESFGQVIRTTAQILPSQGDERIVIAKTNGIAMFTDGNIVEGKAVVAGQTLLALDGGEMADNNLAASYAEAESRYKRAKTEYERKKELAVDKIVSQSDLLQAETDFINAEAKFNNMRRNFASGKQTVSSPIDGYVTGVYVQNGQFVEAGSRILVISRNRDLLIKAELQPKYFNVLGGIVSANIRALNDSHTYTLDELGGRVLSFGKSVDADNPLIPVVFQVNNKAGLLPGSFVEMYITTKTNSQAITAPNESIVEEFGNFFVYVQLTPELFEKRTVETGATNGLRTEITAGIKAGERIVGKGAILVKLAQSSGSLDVHAGHAH
ncbi:MAG: efflux RND transporter periplasmic adaptor subunit [Tannerella sp.]|jgi:RND family efflux transporter MFP subunit|nr:efflux RND transporter periplasmic adaptor subunit [Tannerella sp.]